MIYFQGTDDKLWALNPDGTGGANIGGYKTRSTPAVAGGFIYFQGTDDKLWKVKLDGSGGVNLGGFQSASSPIVTDDKVYFQGTDNTLWALNLDGTGGTNLGYKTKSSPCVAGNYLYFQGTDNKLWRVQLDGSAGVNLGLYQTNSTPFVSRDSVYFQGTDDKLWKITLDGSSGTNLGGYKTSATPFATRTNVYFRGTDDTLWRTDLNGNGGTNLGGYKTKSSPIVDFGNNVIFFQGADNAVWRINMDGSGGAHIGGFDSNSKPFVLQPDNQVGVAQLPYYILTLLYAPPGFDGGKSSSIVDYSSSSNTGTTTTLSTSFKESAGASIAVGPKDNQGSAGFTIAETTTDAQTLDIKKTATNDLSVLGPGADGIDHDEDIFVLWLNPTVTVTVDPEQYVDWELGVNGPTMLTQRVYVGQLKDPSLMSPGLKGDLDAAGLTATDYATILATNPYASADPPIDPARYLPTTQSFPYDPPLHKEDPSPVLKYTQTSAVTNTSTHTAQVQYTVDLGVTGSINLGIVEATLGVTDQLQWTDTSTTTSTNGTTQSATVAVGGPSFGYTGPTNVMVYWDTVFNSWFFHFPTVAASVSGIMKGSDGKPAAHAEVVLTSGRQTFRTFTNAKGAYRFFGTPTGTVKLSVVKRPFNVKDIVAYVTKGAMTTAKAKAASGKAKFQVSAATKVSMKAAVKAATIGATMAAANKEVAWASVKKERTKEVVSRAPAKKVARKRVLAKTR
jgi:hypothetical protein